MKRLDAKIHVKAEIKATPDVLYRLVTTAEGWDAWFTRGMVFDLRKDGECLFSWKNWGADRVTETERAVVRDFSSNRFLRFGWNFFLAGGPTEVEILLSTRGESTTLIEIIQTDFPDTLPGLNMLTQCSAGWAEALTLLKVFVEHGISYN